MWGRTQQSYVGHWPNIDVSVLDRWAQHATILRCLRVIGWDTTGLASWPEKPLGRLAQYQILLRRALINAGWR